MGEALDHEERREMALFGCIRRFLWARGLAGYAAAVVRRGSPGGWGRRSAHGSPSPQPPGRQV